MNDCYHYKKIIYNDVIFPNNMDATYILHLENNGRFEHIMNQLSIYHPTKTVYIVYNKGYKKCKKKDFIKNPSTDLIDGFIHIFKHAELSNYNNILILEDDFIFNKQIKDHVTNINSFLIKKKDDEFIYFIGCIPGFMIPYDFYTYQNVINVGSHAAIYSKKYRNKILNTDQKTISDWDLSSLKYFHNKFCYYKPLCYQLFIETENSKYWGYYYNVNHILFYSLYLFKLLNMDREPEPGFSFFYFFAKTFWLFILFLIIFFMYKSRKMKMKKV